MKRREIEAQIPGALAKIHSEGEPAAFYNEMLRQILQDDERYVSRRTAIRNLLSKVSIDFPVIPSFPLSPGPAKVYPALANLENSGVIEGIFQPAPEDGTPARRMYRLAQDPDSVGVQELSQQPELKKRSPRHTVEELALIRETFGPGSDIALNSIRKQSGYKVVVVPKNDDNRMQ